MNNKDLMIFLLCIIVFICLYMMIIQQADDKAYCDNMIVLERAKLCGLPVYDVNSGRIITPSNTSK